VNERTTTEDKSQPMRVARVIHQVMRVPVCCFSSGYQVERCPRETRGMTVSTA
jgi:hypothetical protein